MSSTAAVLLLAVAEHRCGLPAECVVGLHRMVAAVPLPGAPSIVEGVIDVRGTALAVINLRRRLGLADRPVNPDDHLVVLRLGTRLVAVRADRALDVVMVDAASLETAAGLPDVGLSGMARLDDGLLLIHDVETFLSDRECATLDDALASLAAVAS